MTDQTEPADVRHLSNTELVAEIRHEFRRGNRNRRNLYATPLEAGQIGVVGGDLEHAAAVSDWLADAARNWEAAGHPMPVPPTVADLLDPAAENGHDAMFEGELPAEGIERELWHKVVLAVLDTPGLLPAKAAAARADAQIWRRACDDLAADNERLKTALGVERGALWVLDQIRAQLGVAAGSVAARVNEIVAERDDLSAKVGEAVRILREAGVIHGEGLAERVRNLVAERDQLKTRLDGVRAQHRRDDDDNCVVCWDSDGNFPLAWPCETAHAVDCPEPEAHVRAPLQGGQPTEPDKTWCPRCLMDATDGRYTQESSTQWRCGGCDAVLVVPDPPLTPVPDGRCPNTPPCDHPAMIHDISGDPEDPRPMCCIDGCTCGGTGAKAGASGGKSGGS